MITLEQALALPQAKYQTVAESGIDPSFVASVGMDAVIYTNPTSLLPIPHTDGFSACTCIMIENMKTGAMVLGHVVTHRKEALEQMIASMRRGSRDKLQVHMLGALWDDPENPKDNPKLEQEWRKDSQELLDVLNARPNIELVTFDMGTKPHPTSVAFYKDAAGQTQLVRGSLDFRSNAECEEPRRAQANTYRQDFKGMENYDNKGMFRPSADEPYKVLWDGRLPENQDWDRNPDAYKAANKDDKRAR